MKETKDGHFSRDRVANARNGDRGSQGGLAPHHPDRKFPTGCAGAATRIFQRDLPGLMPRLFFAPTILFFWTKLTQMVSLGPVIALELA